MQTQPDLKTLEGAKQFLNYHAPDEEMQHRHAVVNEAFLDLLSAIWSILPDGPGKTVAIRVIGSARMSCNSVIANNGG